MTMKRRSQAEDLSDLLTPAGCSVRTLAPWTAGKYPKLQSSKARCGVNPVLWLSNLALCRYVCTRVHRGFRYRCDSDHPSFEYNIQVQVRRLPSLVLERNKSNGEEDF